eukprot:CAMPEP_0117427226 /NCGR_PEP_ID=MMETSP0758-20121206/7127_1 /TAXON_ID=63605 /ORGANISM="Percolomonas cosmopolitus, Strain AE-1 (ATCC 50343)" /LENGTH=368 /DNA_ID=CAMNT_0005212757 /DNA_START=817 /DNA_END=1921 /DNA_ORIENTATION=-
MIKFDPNKRYTHEQILKDEYIKKLNDEKQKEQEEETKEHPKVYDILNNTQRSSLSLSTSQPIIKHEEEEEQQHDEEEEKIDDDTPPKPQHIPKMNPYQTAEPIKTTTTTSTTVKQQPILETKQIIFPPMNMEDVANITFKSTSKSNEWIMDRLPLSKYALKERTMESAFLKVIDQFQQVWVFGEVGYQYTESREYASALMLYTTAASRLSLLIHDVKRIWAQCEHKTIEENGRIVFLAHFIHQQLVFVIQSAESLKREIDVYATNLTMKPITQLIYNMVLKWGEEAAHQEVLSSAETHVIKVLYQRCIALLNVILTTDNMLEKGTYEHLEDLKKQFQQRNNHLETNQEEEEDDFFGMRKSRDAMLFDK